MPVITTAIATAAGAPLLLGAAAGGWTSYTVREGDTVSDIATSHRTDVRTLVRANHLSDGGHLIRAGAVIRVPTLATARPRAAAPAVRLARYTVRTGDTLGHIALRFAVPESTLRRLNHLNRSGQIYAGHQLTVPLKAARQVASSARASRSSATGVRTTRYTVRSGDTVGAIALRTGSSTAAILKANRLARTSRIVPGQVLSVPTTTGATTSNTFAGRTYPASVVGAAARNRARLASTSVPGRAATRALIVSTARRYGVDPALALAVGFQESGWNQRQVSVANAIGCMQVIPSSGRWAADLVGRPLDLLSTRDNVTAGVVILKALTRSASSTDVAIAGYYQGLGSVNSRGMYADTKRYVRSVRLLMARFD